MDAFLQQQKERGALDSSGGFSVNPFKAREKMASFQSEDKGFYLLRLVQAAVKLECKMISIVLGRDEMTFRAQGGRFGELCLSKVEASFGQLQTNSVPDAQGYLINSLNHAFVSSPELLRLSILERDGVSRALTISPDRMEQTHSSYVGEASELTLKIKRNYRADQLADETRSIYTRCACCQVPLFLDGNKINTKENPHSHLYTGAYPRTGLHAYLPPNFVLGEKYLKWRDGYEISLRKPSLRRSQLRREGMEMRKGSRRHELFLLDAEGESWDGLLKMPLDGTALARFVFVQSGVIVSQKTMPFRGLDVFICVDDMETDLSGTQLIENSEYQSLERFLHHECRSHVLDLIGQLQNLYSRFDWTPERKAGATAGAVFGAIYLGSALTLLAVPVFGKIWAAGMLASTGLGTRLGLRAKENLDSELREMVAKNLDEALVHLNAESKKHYE